MRGSALVDVLCLLGRDATWGAIPAVGWRALGLLDRRLTVAENETLRGVVDRRHRREAPWNVEAVKPRASTHAR